MGCFLSWLLRCAARSDVRMGVARRKICCAFRAGLFLLMALSSPSASVMAADDPYGGTSSRAAREEAIAALPLERLTAEQRQAVASVLNDVSVYRRMPTCVLRCDPELYHFTLDNPEILVNIWHLLGLEDIVLERIAPTRFRAEDGVGTLGTAEVIDRSHDSMLVYGEGSYDGPLFVKPVRGRCLMFLRSRTVRETDGHYYITSRLDVFVALEQAGVELLAKTFGPLMTRVADYNFTQSMAFVQSLAEAAERNPHGVQRLARRLDGIPSELREEFGEVAWRVAERAEKRHERVVRTPDRKSVDSAAATR